MKVIGQIKGKRVKADVARTVVVASLCMLRRVWFGKSSRSRSGGGDQGRSD